MSLLEQRTCWWRWWNFGCSVRSLISFSRVWNTQSWWLFSSFCRSSHIHWSRGIGIVARSPNSSDFRHNLVWCHFGGWKPFLEWLWFCCICSFQMTSWCCHWMFWRYWWGFGVDCRWMQRARGVRWIWLILYPILVCETSRESGKRYKMKKSLDGLGRYQFWFRIRVLTFLRVC